MADHDAPLGIERLVVDYHQVLYRYAFRLTGSVADAEDLSQQTFLIAQQKLGQVRAAHCVRAWLFTVLRNCYLRARRQRLPVAAVDLDFDVNSVPAVPHSGGNDFQIDSQQLQLALNGLADEFKLVVLMFYFEYRSYREIAELLEIPPGTVMSRLARAKAHLRQALAGADGPPTVRPAIAPESISAREIGRAVVTKRQAY